MGDWGLRNKDRLDSLVSLVSLVSSMFFVPMCHVNMIIEIFVAPRLPEPDPRSVSFRVLSPPRRGAQNGEVGVSGTEAAVCRPFGSRGHLAEEALKPKARSSPRSPKGAISQPLARSRSESSLRLGAGRRTVRWCRVTRALPFTVSCAGGSELSWMHSSPARSQLPELRFGCSSKIT